MSDPQVAPDQEQPSDDDVTTAEAEAPEATADAEEATESEATQDASAEDAEDAVPAKTARNRKASTKTKKKVAKAEAEPEAKPYAVIATGGKQYRVSVGDWIEVEKLDAEAGSEVTIDQVLLIGGNGEPQIGTPLVEGAVVTATVDAQFRGEKIVVFKYKPKKRYRRKMGHRQSLTKLTITGINS